MPEWSKADKTKAVKTIRDVRDGKGGRNAQARIVAARFVLDDGTAPTLESASDAELLAEVSRRGLQVPTVDLDAAERAMEAERANG